MTAEYSVIKIRSNHGTGLENLNISVIPLDDKKEYSIKDFEDTETPEMMTLLESGQMKIGAEVALWKKVYIETSGIKSNNQIKEMLSAPSFMYKESEKHAVSELVQLVRNNHLYTITCATLDSTKELALKRFDDYNDLFLEMTQSFSFEKGQYHSSEYNFSIDIPDGWSKFSPMEGSVVRYGKLGSGENFVIRANAIPFGTKVENLTWQDLFYPQYNSLHIEKTGLMKENEIIFKYCIYNITDQYLKNQQEGEYDLKYISAVFIHNQQLFLITFTDSAYNFQNNYSIFMNTLKSIIFE